MKTTIFSVYLTVLWDGEYSVFDMKTDIFCSVSDCLLGGVALGGGGLLYLPFLVAFLEDREGVRPALTMEGPGKRATTKKK